MDQLQQGFKPYQALLINAVLAFLAML